jgi:hypothetical protein
VLLQGASSSSSPSASPSASTSASPSDGAESACEPGLPSDKVYDGLDNGGDGEVDEDLETTSCGVGE